MGPVLACGDEGPGGSLARLRADPGRWRAMAMHVDDAVVLDFDGDGEDEGVVLSRSGKKLALGHGSGHLDGWRSMVHFDAAPVGLEALPGEVAVALTEPPQVVIFGVDTDGRLERRRDVALRSSPAALRSSDLAGDGTPELIATLPQTGRIAVVDPYWGDVREYAVGGQPSELAVGDVDGDGRLDVVVVDAPAGALHVLRGAGDGSLKPASTSPSSTSAIWLELADYDGDGDLDAVARDLATNVLVHLNDGGGRFSSPAALPFFGAFPEGAGMAVGPVASSGLVGVSVPQGEMMGTWFGKGATWLGHSDNALFDPPTWVGAGRNNLVLVGGASSLSLFAWRSSATPIEVWRGEELALGVDNEVALATGDLDDDHLLDFAATAHGALHLFRGRADLGFELTAQFELDEFTFAMVIADVTGDGRSEIVINEGTRARAFFRGDDGQYVAGPSFAPGVSPLALVPLRTGPTQPVVIAALPRPPFNVAQAAGASLLRFAADGAVALDVLTDALFVDALVAVDVDEDGVDEPLLVGRRDGNVVLTRMTPDGAGFSPGVEYDLATLSEITPTPSGPRFFAAGDLDGDGAPEVFIDVPDGRLRITGLTDDAPQATFEPMFGPTDLRDVDGDGLLDAVFFHLNQFYYQRGHGDGTFAAETHRHTIPRASKMAFAAAPNAQFDIVALGRHAVSAHLVREAVRPVWAGDAFDFHGPAGALVSADLDLDGHDDVVTRSFDGGIAWMWGSETDPLARADGSNGLHESEGLAVGDLDGDGFSEVLSADPIYRLHAYRAFPWREEPELVLDELQSSWIVRLAIADVDADGRSDILALQGGNEIELVVAHGTAEPFRYEPWMTVATVQVSENASLQLGDVDDDGDLDVVIDPVSASGVLVRAVEARVWAEPEVLPGEVAMFSRADADGRVDLVTQEGTTIYRHVDGDPDRRIPLITDEEAVLLRAADADGDGRYDLAVSEPEAAFVWLRGDDGLARVQVAEGPFDVVDFPDIDGDRRPDLVALTNGEMFVRCTSAPATPPGRP